MDVCGACDETADEGRVRACCGPTWVLVGSLRTIRTPFELFWDVSAASAETRYFWAHHGWTP